MVIVIGLAAVVAVLLSALALAQGFTKAASKTGNPSRAIVLTGDAETASSFTRDARSSEIATLRAIGFGPGAVAASVIIEALLLALAGALAGALIAWFLLDGSNVSAMTGISNSQLTFGLAVDSRLFLVGIASAAVVAVIRGSLAAVRAARIPVADALRMT